MKHLLITLLCLFPMWVQAQSEKEIRQAMDAFDYEIPINRIVPASGDSVLTPFRAQALKAMNRPAEALKEWNSLLSPDSTNVKVLAELAEGYRQINRNDLSSRCYAKVVALNPENKFFRQQHIRSLLALENYEAARDASLDWLKEDTLLVAAYKFLGMAYEGLASRNLDALMDAFDAYNRAYRLDSLDGQTVAHLASIFNGNEQFADAINITELYRQSDTIHIDVNRQNAKAYCMMKNYPIAVGRYEALKSMGDRSFTTLYYLGISHYGNECPSEARDNLLEAHRKSPQDVNVLYYLAKSSSNSYYKKEGLEYMKEALELVIPKDSVVMRLYEGLVDCYESYTAANPYEYIEVMKKTYSMNKKYTLFYRIAQIYDRQKDYANAIHYYEKFMSMVPKDKRVALDKDGKPSKRLVSRYQLAQERVEKIKAEEFFRNGDAK